MQDDYRAVVVSTGRKRRLEVAVKGFARRVGLNVERAKPPMEDRRRRQLMGRHGVDLVIDVGANEGQYGRRLRASGYTGRIVSFEPLEDAYRRLAASASSDPLWECFHLGMAESSGSAVLHVSADTYSSSLLAAEDTLVRSAPGAAHVRDEQVQTVTLADVADEIGLTGHQALLKLDVQGYERKVLEGARPMLSTIPLLELELSVRRLYSGQELYLELLALLDAMGYRPAVLWEEFIDLATASLNQFNVIAERDR